MQVNQSVNQQLRLTCWHVLGDIQLERDKSIWKEVLLCDNPGEIDGLKLTTRMLQLEVLVVVLRVDSIYNISSPYLTTA
jgi:hypothetical protein